MPIVDTHAHVYHPDESLYPMVENPSRPPEATGTVDHLERNMAEAGVERAVLVQTGSAYRWDNRLLADCSRTRSEWAVGVCTLDPRSEGSVGTLTDLVENHNVRGLRMEETKDAHPLYYHHGAVRLWESAQELNVVICAHLRTKHLPQLGDLLSRYPEVPVVLDHAAYPSADEGVDSETVNAVIELTRFQHLHVKLTFGVTGSNQTYPFADTHDILRTMIEHFGPDRCMWGSDFPCEHWLKKANYVEHLDLIREALGLSAGARSAILEETPSRLWFG